jgi:hypothetical protein
VRDPPADRVEVVELELHVSLAGDREEVEDGVRRPGDRHHDGDRVLERLPSHDLPRPQVELEDVRGRDAALASGDLSAVVDGGRARGAGERHPQRLADGRHRVRGVHAGA